MLISKTAQQTAQQHFLFASKVSNHFNLIAQFQTFRVSCNGLRNLYIAFFTLFCPDDIAEIVKISNENDFDSVERMKLVPKRCFALCILRKSLHS